MVMALVASWWEYRGLLIQYLFCLTFRLRGQDFSAIISVKREKILMPRVSNLAMYRRRRTLTQEELATLSGVSRATIAALEMGHRGAHLSTIEKLARVLKVKSQELIES